MVAVYEEENENVLVVFSIPEQKLVHRIETQHKKVEFLHMEQVQLFHNECSYYITDISGDRQYIDDKTGNIWVFA